VIYKSKTEVILAALDAYESGDTEKMEALRDLFKFYDEQFEESKKYGYVGVGCITYAEEAMIAKQKGLLE